MGKRLYCGNLSYEFSSADLEGLFAPYGAVRSADVVMDRDTGRSKGFGFVEMERDADADKAVQELNDTPQNGRPITVNEARPREARTGGGSRGGGSRGGKRW